MRTPLIAGNWKMFKTVAETVKHVKVLRPLVKDITDVEIVVAPPFPSIHAAAEALRGSNIALAGQDLYWEREGAFTGEVSAPMLVEAGAELVIIGHSERRTLFGETDASVNRKVGAAFSGGLTPIACIGETLDQRERNGTFDVLDRQIKAGLDGVTSEQLGRLVLAYEPVWAIGTGKNATPDDAAQVHQLIRFQLGRHGIEHRVPILYGGSVKADNAGGLLTQDDIDGALVGGASLRPDVFGAILRAAAAAAAAA